MSPVQLITGERFHRGSIVRLRNPVLHLLLKLALLLNLLLHLGQLLSCLHTRDDTPAVEHSKSKTGQDAQGHDKLADSAQLALGRHGWSHHVM